MLKRISGITCLLWCGFAMAAVSANDTVAMPVSAATPRPAEAVQVRHQSPLELPAEIKAIMARSGVSENGLSIYIRDLNADAPMLVLNEQIPRNPASTMKLVTTWAALKVLGPAYVWKTESWLRGELRNGALDGDLVLKGYGDPFLTDEAFSEMLHDLQIKGLKEIRGNLVIDNSYFQLGKQDPAEFDNEPTKVYNAPPSALMVNFQATRFLFEADEANHRVNITPFPAIPGLQLDNRVSLSKGGCRKQHYRPDFKYKGQTVRVTGSYSAACGKDFVLRVLSTPEQHAFDAFRDTWHSLGGIFNGSLRIDTVKEGDVLLHTHISRTLGEQIRFINKWSNNVMARILMLTAGVKLGGVPGTPEKGRAAIARMLKDAGIDYTGMVVENGSGLSRQARVSARQLGSLLEVAWRDPYMPEFMASMPLLGEDGTLASRFDKEDLRGRSHMKTGTLRDATAIAGYMLTRNGKRLVVVLQYNGANAQGGGRKVHDAILRWAFEQ